MSCLQRKHRKRVRLKADVNCDYAKDPYERRESKVVRGSRTNRWTVEETNKRTGKRRSTSRGPGEGSGEEKGAVTVRKQ